MTLLLSGVTVGGITVLFLRPLLIAFGGRGQTLEYAMEYTRIIAVGTPLAMLGTGASQLIRAKSSRFSAAEMHYILTLRFDIFRIYLFCIFIVGLQLLCTQFFSSIGKGGMGLFVPLLRRMLLLLPVVLILPIFLGMDGVLWAGSVAGGTCLPLSPMTTPGSGCPMPLKRLLGWMRRECGDPILIGIPKHRASVRLLQMRGVFPVQKGIGGQHRRF